MRRLFLLRHAKSSWDDAALDDFDRPLSLRGRASAPVIGRHMADHALLPDFVLCSSARRTRDTLAGLLPFMPGDFDVRFLAALYEADEERHLDLLRRHGGETRSVLVVGHNPGIAAAALALIGRGNPAIVDQIREKFPTAGLAVIDFEDGRWADLAESSGRIVAFFRPRELSAVDAQATEVDD